MIGKLKGVVDGVGEDHLILDVGGVGYLLYASAKTLAMLDTGQAASLLVETHVREDHIHLYGFVRDEERSWFRTLMTVKGVGPRMALAILSTLTPAELLTAIAAQDKTAFRKTSGVGPKLAERIVTELKSEAGKAGIGRAISETMPPENRHMNDAVLALVNLGYGRSESYEAIRKAIAVKKEAAAAELVTLGLKELVA